MGIGSSLPHPRLRDRALGSPGSGPSWKRRALLAGVGLLALATSPGFARADEATSGAGDPATQVETVVVTARRRTEDIQATPLSVTAVSGAQLQAQAAVGLADVKSMAPNVVFDQVIAGPSAAAVYMRGIGYSDIEKSLDPAVGILIDGVQMGTNTGQLAHSFDFESVEVLRGPQGTLFGRNTTGGVINVRRSRPTGVWGANLGVTEGSYGRQEYNAVVNLPKLADVLSTKLFYDYASSDGYYFNATTLKHEPHDRHLNYGVTFLLAPSDNFQVQVTAESTRDRGQIVQASLSRTPNPATDPAYPFYDLICFALPLGPGGSLVYLTGIPANECDRNKGKDLYTTFSNGQDSYFYNVDALTGEVNWTVGKVKLTSITGYQNERERTVQDFDAASIDFYSADRAEKYKQFSEELRAAGPVTDDIDFVAGAFYWHSDYSIVWKQILGAFLAPPVGAEIDNFTHYDTKSYAVFGDVDWRFLPQWRLSLGARYTKDTKTMDLTSFTPPVGAPNDFHATPAAAKSTNFSPKVSLDWRPNDSIMFYALYSQGFRSGGLNTRAATLYAADTPFRPEKVRAFELGTKTSWFDRRLILNADVFWTDYIDKQELVVSPTPPGVLGTQTIVANAGSATIKGLELELVGRPTRGLTVRADLGLLDAHYDKFLECDPTVIPCTTSSLLNEKSLTFVRAPKVTFNVGFDYTKPTEIGDWTLSATYSRVSPYASSIVALPGQPGVTDPIANVQAQNKLEASLSWEHKLAAGDLRITVYGRNLLDERGLEGALEASGLWAFGFGREPRTFGVMANYKF